MIDPKKFEALSKELRDAMAAAEETACALKAANEAHRCANDRFQRAGATLRAYVSEHAYGDKRPK